MKVWGAFPVADGPSAVETACGVDFNPNLTPQFNPILTPRVAV